jgi:hypothetical protein
MIVIRCIVRGIARAAAFAPLFALSLCFPLGVTPAFAAETLNAYSIWPEN